MTLAATAAELLSRRLGLSQELLDGGVIERALEVIFAKLRPEERDSTAVRLLESEGEEWQWLVDEVVVPETWFFRHGRSFQFLATYVAKNWGPAHLTRTFQALCIPCASGEEPYSVAMSLLEAGLDGSRIRVDAADISERLLARARLAVYGKTSFREKPGRLREAYFIGDGESRRVREEVVALVRFEKANLLDVSHFRERAPYDAIFCRNALIYLHERARHEVLSQMSELLADEGLLFTGYTELPHFCGVGYVPVDYPESFACYKEKPVRDRAPRRSPAAAVATTVLQRATTARVAPSPGITRSIEPCPASKPPLSLKQAELLADRGDLDTASAACERLLEEGVRNPRIYALLGVISESRGRVESAEEFFRRALYLAPNHYESLLHMSLLSERRGDVEGARRYRARAARARTRWEGKEVLKSL